MTDSITTKIQNTNFLVSAIALLSAISISSIAGANEIDAGDEIKISSSLLVGNIRGGNAWVNESDAIWQRGVITAIEVCAGDSVNKITPLYDGRRGTELGGLGGTCNTWIVPVDQYIQSVVVWSGDWMNKIMFVTNEQEKSPEFGGPGGNRKVWEDPEGGSLRKIDGKSGSYVNALRLSFSYPYYLTNFKYTDFDALTNPMKPRPIVRIDAQEVTACQSVGDTSTQKLTVSEEETETHSFSFGGSATIGLSTTVEAGIPDIASVGITATAEVSVNFEETNTYEEKKTYTYEASVFAPKGTTRRFITTLKKADVTVPFTYDLIHYRDGKKTRVVQPIQSYSGVYRGVRIAIISTEQIDIDCITGKPVIDNPRTPQAKNPKPPITDKTPAEPEVVTEPVFENKTVTTQSISYAATTAGADFKRDGGAWYELSADGDIRFTYDVTGRDDDRIYLRDRNRGIIIIIDITRSKIAYAPNSTTKPFDLYDISEIF